MQKIFYKLRENTILQSSLGLLLISFLVKGIGYIEKIILAYYYGTSYQVDVFSVVITIILSFFYFFREIVEPGFLNVFLKARIEGKKEVAWNLFNKILRLILIVTILISITGLLFPGQIINLFAPGFKGIKLGLSAQLIQIAIPACIFLAISSLTSITLNGLKVFALPASGEIVFKGLIIFCLIIFYKSFGIVGAAIGIVAGSIGRLGVHMIKLHNKVSFKPVKLKNEYMSNMWMLSWPLLIGVTFSQLSGLIDNVFASYLQEGSIAALSYAKKIIDLPVIIFPYILSVVVFPYFSQLSIEKKQERLSFLLSESLRWIVIVFIPISIFFFFYASPIIEVILQRGAFDAHSTLITAMPMSVYALGLVFFALETIIVVFYYSKADTRTPIFVGIVCVIVNIVLAWLFIKIMGYVGIALAFVVQKSLKNMILLFLLKRKIQIDKRKVFTFLLKTILAGALFAIVIILFKTFLWDDSMKLKIRMIILTCSFLAGMSLYCVFLYYSGELKIKKINPVT